MARLRYSHTTTCLARTTARPCTCGADPYADLEESYQADVRTIPASPTPKAPNPDLLPYGRVS